MRSMRLATRTSAFPLIDRKSVLPLTAVGWALAVAVFLAVGGNLGVRGSLALAALPLLLAVVTRSTRGTLIGLVVWLVALGLIRRLIPSGTGSGISDDPLLLVGPAALGFLFIVSAGRGAFQRATPLASSVLLLSLLAFVEAFNPLQGGILVGLGGLLLVLVPMLAFWVGRVLVDRDLLRLLLRLISILAALEAFYGLVQQFAGFPSWDERWINSSGYAALNVGGFTRSFGSFSSSQEYAVFLSIGLVLWLALFTRGRITWTVLQLAVMALIVVALVLEAQRSALVVDVFALGTMAAARTGRRPTGAVLIGAIFLLLLYFGVSQFASPSSNQPSSSSSTSALTSHDITGITEPGQSTLPLHISEVEAGIVSGFTVPIGHGTGSITLAVNHLGDASILGTEFDPGNAAAAFGFVGLLLYLILVKRAFGTTYRLAALSKDPLCLAVLGIASATVLQWLNGDLYSVAWLFWLTLGWADHQSEADFRQEVALDLVTTEG
jgi:hypothetical protein